MGVGKTTVCQQLKQDLPNSVFLDGDWCWDANPFQVTDETKAMVTNNMCYLLNNFVKCSAWETPFVAIVNGQIVGMTTIMKSDYYPLPEIFPWISTLFVSEDYRGNRISRKLIDFANQYAKSIGFDKTYIPTEFIGLYEKYGYCYVKDIVNYGNGIDRLYVREIK